MKPEKGQQVLTPGTTGSILVTSVNAVCLYKDGGMEGLLRENERVGNRGEQARVVKRVEPQGEGKLGR